MRRIASLTLLYAGLLLVCSSIVLYIMPSGRVAYWADWHLLGLSKTQWGALHITHGFLIVAASIVHIWFNWRPILNYLRNAAKAFRFFTPPSLIALGLSAVVTVGSIYPIPPMSWILDLGEAITDSANEHYGEPPYGHAELSTLRQFCDRMRIDFEVARGRLQQAGFELLTEEATLAMVAAANGVTPQLLFDAMKDPSQAGATAALGDHPQPGFGRRSLAEVCSRHGLDIAVISAALQEAGYSVAPGDSIKTISATKDGNNMALFEVIRQAAQR